MAGINAVIDDHITPNAAAFKHATAEMAAAAKRDCTPPIAKAAGSVSYNGTGDTVSISCPRWWAGAFLQPQR